MRTMCSSQLKIDRGTNLLSLSFEGIVNPKGSTQMNFSIIRNKILVGIPFREIPHEKISSMN